MRPQPDWITAQMDLLAVAYADANEMCDLVCVDGVPNFAVSRASSCSYLIMKVIL